MNITNPINVASARRRIVTTLWITVACALIAGMMLFHFIRETRSVERDLAATRLELHARKQPYRSRTLVRQVAEAKQRKEDLQQSWEQYRLQVDTFQGSLPEHARLTAADDARIDFKVALFNARQSLQELAKSRGVALADDLGVAGTIGAQEDTETRLWELGAVLRLVELILTTGVNSIDAIEALPPFIFSQVPDENESALAFPVRVTLQCTYAQLQPLLAAVSREECFYAISQCEIAKPSIASNTLQVQLVCSALRFVVDAVISPEAERTAPRRRGARE